MNEREAAYQRAAEIADVLLAQGVPLIGFAEADYGDKLSFAFQLREEDAKYVVRVSRAEATPERVLQLYEAVA
jgi:hypothetical protein